MRIFRPVVQIAMLPMFDTGQDLAHGGTVASQLIHDHHSMDISLALEKLANEGPGGFLVAPTLDENIQHVAVLIHRPPEGVTYAMHGQTHIIQMPHVAWLGAPALADCWPHVTHHIRMAS
jgi:hypothetical protein